ncbi:hypothetical protein AGMMS50267_14240 [Spirochaetia bacterium]|nr:hypothetical protein AGMMS50267_14240 [Spirochaetia bacterium]
MPKAKRNEEPKINSEYVLDFEKKVERLQKTFAGKNRGDLYEKLKAKGVFTDYYSKDDWNNDIKAWKEKPNNGIFNHLEMVGSILEEVAIPAFEVFGGPQAKDSDEVAKGVSSDIIKYLEKYVKPNRGRKIERKERLKERIINKTAFENMVNIYCLIKLYRERYAAFFSLYAWNDLGGNNNSSKPNFPDKVYSNIRKPGIIELITCIKKIAGKIFDGPFVGYYYAYFNRPFGLLDKRPEEFVSSFLVPFTAGFFDNLGNSLLIIAYQLNSILPVYNLYKKKGAFLYNHSLKKEPPEKKMDELTTLDSLEWQPDEKEPSIFDNADNISFIEEKCYAHLNIEETKDPDGNSLPTVFFNDLNEIKQKLIELVNQYISMDVQRFYNINEDTSTKMEFSLKCIIDNLLLTMEFLNYRNKKRNKPDIIKHIIDEKNKKPITIIRQYFLLTVYQKTDDLLKFILNNMEEVSGLINNILDTNRPADRLGSNNPLGSNTPPVSDT